MANVLEPAELWDVGAGVVKFGLSEKHSKFEKIFLMVWMFTKDGFRGNDSLIL